MNIGDKPVLGSDDYFQCIQTVHREISVFKDSASREVSSCDTMAVVILVSAEIDPGRFRRIYEMMRFIEDPSFWWEVNKAYSPEITGLEAPFENRKGLLRHAEEIERIYHRHGFHNMEVVLLG